jgi:hypothetical protein
MSCLRPPPIGGAGVNRQGAAREEFGRPRNTKNEKINRLKAAPAALAQAQPGELARAYFLGDDDAKKTELAQA